MTSKREKEMTLEKIFSTRGLMCHWRWDIGDGIHTFSLKAQREKEDEDNSKITTKHNKNGKSKEGRRKPSIYTQNRALMCI